MTVLKVQRRQERPGHGALCPVSIAGMRCLQCYAGSQLTRRAALLIRVVARLAVLCLPQEAVRVQSDRQHAVGKLGVSG